MTKADITEWVLANLKQLKEVFLFIIIVTMGSITKMIVAIRKGRKFTFAGLVSELIMSFFVAITVYGIFYQFFTVNRIFAYTMCAWGGTLSSVFHDKVKDLLVSIFDYVKIWIKIRLT